MSEFRNNTNGTSTKWNQWIRVREKEVQYRRQGWAQDLGGGYSKFQMLAKFFFECSKYTHAFRCCT